MADTNPINIDHAASPGLSRRLAAIGYDAVLVFGVLLLVWTLFYLALAAITGQDDVGHTPAAQLYWPLALLSMVGFHVWFWIHGGQTLGMKSWRLRVVNAAGLNPTLGQAVKRYLWAWLSAAALGAGFLWMLFDRDRLTWHDRLSGTRLVLTTKRGGKPDSVDSP